MMSTTLRLRCSQQSVHAISIPTTIKVHGHKHVFQAVHFQGLVRGNPHNVFPYTVRGKCQVSRNSYLRSSQAKDLTTSGDGALLGHQPTIRFCSQLFRQDGGCRDMVSLSKRSKSSVGIQSFSETSYGVKESYNACQVEEIARQVGARLTPNEMQLLREKLKKTGNGTISRASMEVAGNKALTEKMLREICLSVICTAENPIDKMGVRVINFFDYLGTALFAVVGTQVAGDCGMNIVGCGLVGCAAALGGGSINAMLYGGTNPLLGKPGVRWVANPSYLVTAILASIATFFGWPYYCEIQTQHYIEKWFEKGNLVNGEIDEEVFLETWKHNPDFRQTIREALPKIDANQTGGAGESNSGHAYFRYIDADNSGAIDMQELQALVKHRFYNGWETYTLDTLGLSSLSIAAVSMSIKLGLHPLVAATSGVTVCFGGILRDLLCGRNLAIGSQSYAFATGASSTVYVCLRELAIRRVLILPLVYRTFLSAGTCVGIRAWEYYRGQPILGPMHK